MYQLSDIFCSNDGGGGERVLWKLVESLRKKRPNVDIVIYTGDQVSPDRILKTAEVRRLLVTSVTVCQERFGIKVPKDVRFVYLRSRFLVEKKLYVAKFCAFLIPARWPRFTMLGQSLGSAVLGLEALFRECPDVYLGTLSIYLLVFNLLDTMGYAFTFPVFSLLGGCKIGCYVHYPTISEDMLQNVKSQSSSVNNDKTVAASPFKTKVKLLYSSCYISELT